MRGHWHIVSIVVPHIGHPRIGQIATNLEAQLKRQCEIGRVGANERIGDRGEVVGIHASPLLLTVSIDAYSKVRTDNELIGRGGLRIELKRSGQVAAEQRIEASGKGVCR
jgi:hypothetical protein